MPKVRKKPIDYDKLKHLAESGATKQECAVILDLESHKSIDNDTKARNTYKLGFEKFKTELRVAQKKAAIGFDQEYERDDNGKLITDKYGKPIIIRHGQSPVAEMLKFLGKNVLGQTDRQEVTGKDGAPIVTEKQTIYVMPKNNPTPELMPDKEEISKN